MFHETLEYPFSNFFIQLPILPITYKYAYVHKVHNGHNQFFYIASVTNSYKHTKNNKILIL